MKTLRKIHLYLGCIFAPLIIYFSLSGVAQVFRWNDLPKTGATAIQSALHAASNPHTHSTLPGRDPKREKSAYFDWAAAVMGVGMVLTTLLGIILALRFSKRPALVFVCLSAGVALPILFLFL